jgi:hypothetical protein
MRALALVVIIMVSSFVSVAQAKDEPKSKSCKMWCCKKKCNKGDKQTESSTKENTK